MGKPPKVHRDSSAQPSTTTKGKGKKGALKPAPANRGKNAIISARTTPTKKVPRRTSSVRPNIIARSQTPAEGEGTRITRSGRHSFKPLASWRGEKAVFETTDLAPEGPKMGAIKEIIRTEEIIEFRKPAKYRRGRAQSKKLEDVEEEDEELEDWEREPGIMQGTVMAWDALESHYIEDQTESQGEQSRFYFDFSQSASCHSRGRIVSY